MKLTVTLTNEEARQQCMEVLSQRFNMPIEEIYLTIENLAHIVPSDRIYAILGHSGGKIEAIKLMREQIKGIGLSEAKKRVEDCMAEYHVNYPLNF